MRRIILILNFLAVVAFSHPAWAVTFALNDNPGALEGTPMGTNPSTGQETSSFNLQTAFQALFGFSSPNTLPTQNLWGETPTVMSFGFGARGNSVKVETFQELGLDIFGDYWTLDSKLTFDPSSAIIVDPNDHIIWEGTLAHTGKLSTNDFPHEGDAQAGSPMKFLIDLSAGNKTPALFSQLTYAFDTSAAQHDFIGHTDVVLGIMQARVNSPSIFFDEIEGAYTGILVGAHIGDQSSVVPEPSTIGLLVSGLAGMWMLRRGKII